MYVNPLRVHDQEQKAQMDETLTDLKMAYGQNTEKNFKFRWE